MADPALGSLPAEVAAWAAGHGGVRAVALVGSHAAGRARPGSDIDLVVLAEDPGALLADRSWLGRFGAVTGVTVEDWGAISSLRVRYAGGQEVEWGVGALSWAATDPVDPGTARVAGGGLVALYDADGILARLSAAVGRPAR